VTDADVDKDADLDADADAVDDSLPALAFDLGVFQ
jgi:hypothetical protein